MNDNEPFPTPAQAKACTDIVAAVEGLEYEKRISTLTFVLAAAIQHGARSQSSARAIVDHVALELLAQVEAKRILPGLH